MRTLDHPTQRIRSMIEGFTIPQRDALEECLLSVRNGQQSVTDAGVFISTKQSEKVYSDIFQFWVRAFFCFVESMSLGIFFREAASSVECREISPDRFREAYLSLIRSRVPDSYFTELQQDPQSRVELENRTFSEAYVVLDRSNIKSAVAASDGEYVAYFQTVPKANN